MGLTGPVGQYSFLTCISGDGHLHLAQLGRLVRILRFLKTSSKEEMWAEFKANRAESVLYVTAFVPLVVITVSAVVVLQTELRFLRQENAEIKASLAALADRYAAEN